MKTDTFVTDFKTQRMQNRDKGMHPFDFDTLEVTVVMEICHIFSTTLRFYFLLSCHFSILLLYLRSFLFLVTFISFIFLFSFPSSSCHGDAKLTAVRMKTRRTNATYIAHNLTRIMEKMI